MAIVGGILATWGCVISVMRVQWSRFGCCHVPDAVNRRVEIL